MNRRSNTGGHNSGSSSNKKDSHQSIPQICSSVKQKWSFGRLFKRKKDTVETESSSEEDRKAGFVTSQKCRKKDKKRNSKFINSGGFDHIVPSPARENEFFLPFEPVPQPYEPQSRSTNSLDRRSKRDRKKTVTNDVRQRHSSSEEEIVSLNSSATFAKYRSDESLGNYQSNANGGLSRRSRAARNERYYKRLSRDGEVSHGQVPVAYASQQSQRKSQPVPFSIYDEQFNQIHPPVDQPAQSHYPVQSANTEKPQNSVDKKYMGPYGPVGHGPSHVSRSLQNTVNDSKRSISFDSQIHLQNTRKPMPPPPPPRDPLRRVNVAGHSDHRPISYAFDRNSTIMHPNTGISARCASDDRIWSGTTPLYQSATPVNNPQPINSSLQNRRFITRAERDAHPSKKSLPSGLDYRYIAESAPRSRKPIHMLNQDDIQVEQRPPSPVIIRTTKSGLPTPTNQSNPQLSSSAFSQRGREQQQRPESMFHKSRSLSSSRAGEIKNFSTPMYSQVSKPKVKPPSNPERNSHIVSGSLVIKPSRDNCNNYVEIRNKANKCNSMPNHFHMKDTKTNTLPFNKYDEYVAEKRNKNNTFDRPVKIAPDPPQRKPITKYSESNGSLRKKPTNLEDAINELEAIYKSLNLGDEPQPDRTKGRDIPTPTSFEKYVALHGDEYFDDDDDEEPTREPDLVRDDFAYRSIKRANITTKDPEKQPPFGIPVGPIVPSAKTDYLHVTPEKDGQKLRTSPFKYPDVVSDDLAVRALRKDQPGQAKNQFLYPGDSLKKKRAIRTQSANIYAMIQKSASKPSGGDLDDYMNLAKSIDRPGSMSDLHKEIDDIPSTLQLLRSLREQDQISPKTAPFRHPNQGGAITHLPAVLTKSEEQQTTKTPIPLPRKSTTPDPEKSKIEEALNKIAKEAKESSEKLTRELMELRKEALITSSRTKINNSSIERDLDQIEAVSEAAKRCRSILIDALPPDDEEKQPQIPKETTPRRLPTEDKLIKAIDQVSDAANKVCEKILNEIVTVQPPVVVQNAVEVKNYPKQELVIPTLIQKLDPSSARIGEIAERCMRQISELNDLPDFNTLQPQLQTTTACNTTTNDPDRKIRSDVDLLIVPGSIATPSRANEEEIDMIMKECEQQARADKPEPTKDNLSHSEEASDVYVSIGDNTTTTASASSSSDCLKSSSSSAGAHMSSSITSFNPYSSSDYIKTPSSEFHAPSTDPIKTFSTTSYDVQSSSVTTNITNSPFSYTPSPPLNLNPVTVAGTSSVDKGERSNSTSQYNSSEELAMIFGIDKSSPATTATGKEDERQVVVDYSLPRSDAVFRCSQPNKPNSAAISTTATNPEFCESVLVCKLNAIKDDPKDLPPQQVSRLYRPTYSNNISIIVTNIDGDNGGRHCGSLYLTDDSSNPDSGNVSLSDFPLQSPITTSLEVEPINNSRFEITNRYINEITINRSGNASNTDFLRALFAGDEVSTSFSVDESQNLSGHDDEQEGEVTVKAQDKPRKLLDRDMTLEDEQYPKTQLENISEYPILEGLSDRLNTHGSALKSANGNKQRLDRKVRFSDEYPGREEICKDDVSMQHEDWREKTLTSPKSLEDLETSDFSSFYIQPPFQYRNSVFISPKAALLVNSAVDDLSADMLEDESLTESSGMVSIVDIVEGSTNDLPIDLQPKISRVPPVRSYSEVESITEILDDELVTRSSERVSIDDSVEESSRDFAIDPQLEILRAPPLRPYSEVQTIKKMLDDDSMIGSSGMVSIVDGVEESSSDLPLDPQLEISRPPPLQPYSEVESITEILDDESVRDYSGMVSIVDDVETRSYHLSPDSQEEVPRALPLRSYLEIQSVTEFLKDESARDSSGMIPIIDVVEESPNDLTTDPPFEINRKLPFRPYSEVESIKEISESNDSNNKVGNNTLDSEKTGGSDCQKNTPKIEEERVGQQVHESSLSQQCIQRECYSYKGGKSWDLPKNVHKEGEVQHADHDVPEFNVHEKSHQFSEDHKKFHSCDNNKQGQSNCSLLACLSPVNFSLKIVNEVSKVNLIDCDDLTSSLDHQNSGGTFSDETFTSVSSYRERNLDRHQSRDMVKSILENNKIRSKRQHLSHIVDRDQNDSLVETSKTDGKRSYSFSKPQICSSVTPSNECAQQFESLTSSDLRPRLREYTQRADMPYINQINDKDKFELVRRVPSGRSEHTYGRIQDREHDQEPHLHQIKGKDAQKTPPRSPCSPTPTSDSLPLVSSPVEGISNMSKTLSLLGQPQYDEHMTTLEHILLVCTFGVVTGNDLITMLVLIIGVLTVIAIVLL